MCAIGWLIQEQVRQPVALEMAVNYALQPWELDAGFTLTCQARPTPKALTIDYDAV